MVTSSYPYPFPSIPDALARKTPAMLSSGGARKTRLRPFYIRLNGQADRAMVMCLRRSFALRPYVRTFRKHCLVAAMLTAWIVTGVALPARGNHPASGSETATQGQIRDAGYMGRPTPRFSARSDRLFQTQIYPQSISRTLRRGRSLLT